MGHSEASKRPRFPGCPLRGFQPSGSYPQATDNLSIISPDSACLSSLFRLELCSAPTSESENYHALPSGNITLRLPGKVSGYRNSWQHVLLVSDDSIFAATCFPYFAGGRGRKIPEEVPGPYPQYGWHFPEEIPEKFRKDPGNALRAFPGISLESTAGMTQTL